MSVPGDLVSRDLQWVKPRWTRREFELRSGDAIVATLRWIRGARAEGSYAGSEGYSFQREGWLRQRILIRHAATEHADEPVATLVSRGGTLSYPDGRSFRWGKPKRWTNERVWFDGSGAELMRFSPRRGGAAVTLQPGVATLPELPLLLLLGQYLLELAAQDAAAATSAAMVPIISG